MNLMKEVKAKLRIINGGSSKMSSKVNNKELLIILCNYRTQERAICLEE